MDKHTYENWKKIKELMEKENRTDSFFYKRACMILAGKRDTLELPQQFGEFAVEIFSGIAALAIAGATGVLWRMDKRSSVMDARIGLVLEQITALRSDHKERLDDHEKRLRALEMDHQNSFVATNS